MIRPGALPDGKESIPRVDQRGLGLARGRRADATERLAARLARAKTLDESLRAVCQETAAALDTDRAAVFLFDAHVMLATSAHDADLAVPRTPAGFARGAITALIERHGRTGQFPDLRAFPEVPNQRSMLEMGIRSLAYATITAEDGMLGVLAASTPGPEERVFDADELAFLEATADLAITALITASLSERHRLILTHMSEGVVLTDLSGRILFANPAIERILRYEPGTLAGRSAQEMWFPEDQERRVVFRQMALRDGAAPRHEARVRAQDGSEVWMSNALVKMRLSDTFTGLLVVGTDVTEKRRLDARLAQSQKLESLGVLAGGVAHDFNNLLTGILANAGLALEDGALAREAIADIQASAQRAAELTRQLLAYAGKGRFVVAEIDLGELLGELSYLISAIVPKNAVVTQVLAERLPRVMGDASQLRQVMMSLITNAAEALGDRGGVILVRTDVVDLDHRSPRSTYLAEPLSPGLYVSFEVCDSGGGMSPETQAKIFDPFFTTKVTGRGLGLAAVLGILRSHRGAVDVESEVGQGSTFRVLLPAAVTRREAPAGARSSEPATQGAAPALSGKILVIDDDDAVRRVAERVLVRAGFTVLLADGGREGVELLRAQKGEIRAVLLDLMMPGMSGQDTLCELRRVDSEVPVLVASGYSESEATELLAGQAPTGFVAKPFTPRGLLDHLRSVLNPPEPRRV